MQNHKTLLIEPAPGSYHLLLNEELLKMFLSESLFCKTFLTKLPLHKLKGLNFKIDERYNNS